MDCGDGHPGRGGRTRRKEEPSVPGWAEQPAHQTGHGPTRPKPATGRFFHPQNSAKRGCSGRGVRVVRGGWGRGHRARGALTGCAGASGGGKSRAPRRARARASSAGARWAVRKSLRVRGRERERVARGVRAGDGGGDGARSRADHGPVSGNGVLPAVARRWAAFLLDVSDLAGHVGQVLLPELRDDGRIVRLVDDAQLLGHAQEALGHHGLRGSPVQPGHLWLSMMRFWQRDLREAEAARRGRVHRVHRGLRREGLRLQRLVHREELVHCCGPADAHRRLERRGAQVSQDCQCTEGRFGRKQNSRGAEECPDRRRCRRARARPSQDVRASRAGRPLAPPPAPA